MEDSPTPHPREALAHLHDEHQDAVWERSRSRARLPLDVLTGEVGAKGAVSGRLRRISAQHARAAVRVPTGGAPGTGLLVLGLVAVTVGVAALLLALLVWVAS